MNSRVWLVLMMSLLLLLSGRPVFSAETNAPTNGAGSATNAVNADLNDLVTRINDKLRQDKTNETDLADNLKEFDALVAKHTNAAPADRTQILVMKAQLYLQVLDEPEKALEIFKQIKNDYPTAQLNGNTESIISSLQGDIDRRKSREALVPGALFPDFSETDLKGKPLAISNYKGKVVLVDFWATWCMPCVLELPQVQQAYEKFHSKGFEIVGVSLDEDKGKLEQFIEQKKMPWPEFFDGKRWENKLAVKYGVDSTPTGYLLDRNGKIIAKLASADDLETEVAKALKE